MRGGYLGLGLVLAIGCGSKPAPASATDANNECAAWIVKARPMQEARRRAAGKTWGEADEEKFERYCRQEPTFRTSSEYLCVMAAADEAAVLACGPAPTVKPSIDPLPNSD